MSERPRERVSESPSELQRTCSSAKKVSLPLEEASGEEEEEEATSRDCVWRGRVRGMKRGLKLNREGEVALRREE